METKKFDRLLFMGFAFLLIILLIVSIVSTISLSQTSALFEHTFNHSYAELLQVEEANADLIAIHRGMKDVALSRNADQLAAALSNVNYYKGEIEIHFKALSEMASANVLLDGLIQTYRDWAPIRAKAIAFAESAQYEAAANVTRTEGAKQVELISSKMETFIAIKEGEAERAFTFSTRSSSSAKVQLYVLILAAFLLAVATSLSVRKALVSAERLLFSEKEKLRITLESIGDGVITTDLDRNVQKLNAIAEELTGWTTQEAFGKPFAEVFNITNAYTGEPAKDPVEEVLTTDKICMLENHTILTAKGGAQWHIADSAAPIKDKSGTTSGVVMIFRDVTERRLYQDKLRESEEHYRMLFNTMLNGYALHEMLFDDDGVPYDYRYIDINPAFETMTGLTKEACIGKTIRTLLPSTEKVWFETYGKVVITGESNRFIEYSAALDKYFEVYAFCPMENHFATVVTDVTESKRAQDALHESERSKSVLLSNLPGMAYRCSYDRTWTMQYVSDGCVELTGYQPEELIGNAIVCFNELIEDEFRSSVWEKWTGQLAHKLPCRLEYRLRTADGSVKWVWEQGEGIYDAKGNIIGIEGLIIDITDRKQYEDNIRFLSYRDSLTGLYNRTFFSEKCAALTAEECFPLSVIMGDINGLKLINDIFGHAAGDRLLCEVSKILLCCCPGTGAVARIGGDEFCILLPGTNLEETQKICRDIYNTCSTFTITVDKESFHPSISLGHSTTSSGKMPIEHLLKEAEELMYKHKLLERKSMHSSIITSIKTTMFEKSYETEAHAERMIELSKAVGKALGLTEDQLGDLELLATLHDVGKIGIDDHTLVKCGELSADEWREIKKHPEIGYRIAQASPELISIADYILYHHERWDGGGYPEGRAGEAIPLLSRILAVVDAYDAMTNDRPYRKAMPRDMAVSEIHSNAGKQFDPAVAKIFIEQVLELGGIPV